MLKLLNLINVRWYNVLRKTSVLSISLLKWVQQCVLLDDGYSRLSTAYLLCLLVSFCTIHLQYFINEWSPYSFIKEVTFKPHYQTFKHRYCSLAEPDCCFVFDFGLGFGTLTIHFSQPYSIKEVIVVWLCKTILLVFAILPWPSRWTLGNEHPGLNKF